jgi:hypothetical protein
MAMVGQAVWIKSSATSGLSSKKRSTARIMVAMAFTALPFGPGAPYPGALAVVAG